MAKTKELKEQIEGHGQRNSELFKVLKEKGLSSQDEIEAEYHFWSYDHEDAVQFAKILYDQGFLLLVISPVKEEDEITWNLEARKRARVEDIISSENTEYLIRLADDQSSIYDGWGASV
jgi:Regulator of ribonuclease activity B